MKHRAPLLWRKPDVRRHRFALPNSIWRYKLKPVPFAVLAYLCFCHAHGDAALTAENIGHGIHLTLRSVKKHLDDLRGKSLVTDECSLAVDFLQADSGNYFTLPNEIFLLSLSPSVFLVYAYLLYIEDRRTHQCHPSYNTIAARAGLSRNTVRKSIDNLLERGLINMEHSSYIDAHGLKWKGSNIYTVLPIRGAVDTFHRQQVRRAEVETAFRRARHRLKQYDHRHPKPAV